MITPEEAWKRLEAHLGPLPPVTLPRREALHCRLAAALEATVDVPFADVSAMDGYALSGDPAAGHRLPVAGTIAAGDPPGAVLAAAHAMRIMTGAPLPAGADRVIPVERTDAGIEVVELLEDATGPRHIRRRGEVVAAGDHLMDTGTPLSPAALAVAATHGFLTLPVVRPPRVALLVTGDEIVPADDEPGPGQLRDSHTDFVTAAGRKLGIEVTSLGIAGDDPEVLFQGMAKGLEHDILLVTGGVSMGVFDFAETVLERHGFEILFDRVAVQPGKPLVAAVRESGSSQRRLAFGLPGNPASVMVTFWLFVRPTIRRLQGHDAAFWSDAVRASAATLLPGAKSRDRFVPAALAIRDGGLVVAPFSPLGSHDLGPWVHGEALIRIPAGSDPAPAGSPCEVLPLT